MLPQAATIPYLPFMSDSMFFNCFSFAIMGSTGSFWVMKQASDML